MPIYIKGRIEARRGGAVKTKGAFVYLKEEWNEKPVPHFSVAVWAVMDEQRLNLFWASNTLLIAKIRTLK